MMLWMSGGCVGSDRCDDGVGDDDGGDGLLCWWKLVAVVVAQWMYC